MKSRHLTDICNPKQWKTISTSELELSGYPVYGANGIIGFYSEYNHEDPTVLITCRGATCGEIHICEPKCYVTGNAMALDDLSDEVDIRYLYYFLRGYDFNNIISGSAQPQITRQGLQKLIVKYPHLETQKKIVEALDKAQALIDARKEQIWLMDELVKSRFVEMFGDLKYNNKNWKLAKFTEIASIDTNMVKDFEKYSNYPHIGIDSIEKETGVLKGYRTVKEDGVISGKYLFSSAHIIYSKIRPNLNKVALPDFEGVCSADAYPILPNKGISNREFLGYTMRSKFFLNYILAFSSRTNLPKVNKIQVEGFEVPLPPIEVQNEFAKFVRLISNSNLEMQRSLVELEKNFEGLMYKSFN